MNNIELNGEIIAGERIGQYCLGWSYSKLKEHISEKFEIEKRADCFVVKTSTMMFWVDEKDERIFRIAVFGNFKGKFLNKIGIGSTLTDIEELLGEFPDDNYGYADVYGLISYSGITFELRDEIDDEEEWDEKTFPIEYIFIFIPDPFEEQLAYERALKKGADKR